MTVRIEKVARGQYDAWKVTPYPDGTGHTLDPINTAHISEPIAYGLSVDAWAAELDDNELEAALLIFTDRWTWDEGTPEDKVCLEALEREKEKRDEQENWLHAGSHLTNIALHGAQPQNPVEGRMHVQPNGRVMVYNNGQWCPVSISSQGTIQHAHSQGAPTHSTPTPKKSSP